MWRVTGDAVAVRPSGWMTHASCAHQAAGPAVWLKDEAHGQDAVVFEEFQYLLLGGRVRQPCFVKARGLSAVWEGLLHTHGASTRERSTRTLQLEDGAALRALVGRRLLW